MSDKAFGAISAAVYILVVGFGCYGIVDLLGIGGAWATTIGIVTSAGVVLLLLYAATQMHP